MAHTANSNDENVSLQDLADLMKNRASTYAFIARLFRKEIDSDLLEDMTSMRFPLHSGNNNIDKGYWLIATYLSNIWDNSLTDLAVDYTRTFIGHGNDAYSAAYPFESVYTSEKRLLMQTARDEVLAIYRSEGLDKQSSWKESEDHIAVELEFIEILCQRTEEALRNADQDRALQLLTTQRNFLSDHLVAWVPMLTKDMKKFAKTDMYQGLAYLTEGFLETDHAFLQQILEESDDNDAE